MNRLLIGLAVVIAAASFCAAADDAQDTAATEFKMRPIGHVQKSEDKTLIVLDKEYEPGLLGLDGFSHAYVFWWFSLNDTPEKRKTLQVHPMGNRENPLTGVFATRCPRRPNLLALTLCKIVAVKANLVEVEKIDAFDDTPVIDIKPYLPGYDTTDDAKAPEWLNRAFEKRRAQGKGT
jgi:tRNA-Thr(GGU) m(6)t(6)A37 methyltransferase TsaA